MASSTLIPVQEYLMTSYHPDREYLDGEVKERNLGERPHSLFQHVLGVIFDANRNAWDVLSFPELRVQVAETRFRVPDVCVLKRSDPPDSIVKKAPLLCIEILSPEDGLGGLQDKLADYMGMGVVQVWVIDPVRRYGWMGSANGFLQPEDGVLSVPGTAITIKLADLFAEVDERNAGR